MSDDLIKVAPLSLAEVKALPLETRPSKVSMDMVARPWSPGGTLEEFLQRLPAVLAAADLRLVTEAIVRARRHGRPVLMGLGAHVIKVGLAPLIVDLMERGVLTGVALNGAGIIHDIELALAGKTSEDVASALDKGTFGMSRETAEFLNGAVARYHQDEKGLGALVGESLLARGGPHVHQSIVAAGARLGIPVTVHVAIGTDIIHLHPSVDPAATGAASHLDFRIFSRLVASLEDGVYLNVGSAVLLPEVFLKAVSLARNLGYRVEKITTVNMDFNRHYRPRLNVLERPTRKGGRGIELIGHHEIMLPLLAAAVVEKIDPARPETNP